MNPFLFVLIAAAILALLLLFCASKDEYFAGFMTLGFVVLLAVSGIAIDIYVGPNVLPTIFWTLMVVASGYEFREWRRRKRLEITLASLPCPACSAIYGREAARQAFRPFKIPKGIMAAVFFRHVLCPNCSETAFFKLDLVSLSASDLHLSRPEAQQALPEGWRSPTDDEYRELLAELLRELSPRHILAGTLWFPFATREGGRAVLFHNSELKDGYVWVELTGTGVRETDPERPLIKFTGSLEEFVRAQGGAKRDGLPEKA